MRQLLRSNLATALGLAVLTGVLTAPAAAQVRYDFEAFSSFEFGGEMISGSFSVVAPGFVTTNTVFPVAELLSCTVVSSLGDAAACRDQEFRFDVSPGYGTVSFGIQTSNNPSTSVFYYFDESAFGSPGTYATQLFDTAQAGSLVVTVVPEPSSWALMLGGMAALGALVRRSRSGARPSVA